MPLPTGQTFNELDGEECKAVLISRFAALLDTVPYLQKHITIPRVKMSLLVQLSMYNDQPKPEVKEIADDFNVITLQDTVNASPTPGGRPPDQVRDEHGIGIPTPARVPNLPFHADGLAGQVVSNGAMEIDRTGTGGLTPAGMAKMQHATVVNMDQGPAGLRSGGERERLSLFKNSNRS